MGGGEGGVMELHMPGGGRLAFAMMAKGNAQFVEIDASGGTGEVGSGTMERAGTTAYNTNKIAGNYAFGFTGLDGFNHRTLLAGRFTADGLGGFTHGTPARDRLGIFSRRHLLPGG